MGGRYGGNINRPGRRNPWRSLEALGRELRSTSQTTKANHPTQRRPGGSGGGTMDGNHQGPPLHFPSKANPHATPPPPPQNQ